VKEADFQNSLSVGWFFQLDPRIQLDFSGLDFRNSLSLALLGSGAVGVHPLP
jgi:hypothetical protein